MSTYRRATLQDLAKIGYVPNTELNIGLKKTIEWYEQNGK